MGTPIVERVAFTVAVVGDDNAIAPDSRGNKIAGVLELAVVTDVDPRLSKNPAHFEIEDLRVGIEPAIDPAVRHQIGQFINGWHAHSLPRHYRGLVVGEPYFALLGIANMKVFWMLAIFGCHARVIRNG